MYTGFHIQHFRGFRDLEIRDLGQVNLIAGKNNSGKTALLEAIAITSGKIDAVLARSQDHWVDDAIARTGTLWNQEHTISTIFSLDSLFFRLDAGKPATIQSAPEGAVYRIERIAASSVPASVTALSRHGTVTQLTSIENAVQFTSPAQLGDYIVQTDTEVRWTAEHPRHALIFCFAHHRLYLQELAQRFSQLKIMRQESVLIDALKFFEPRLVGLDLLANGLHADLKGMDKLLPISVMGDGIQRVLTILLGIYQAANGIVLIDEIENGLHYSSQQHVWESIAHAAHQFNVQVFATTHSREMIEAAYRAFQSSDTTFRYHRLDRDEESGDVYVTTYSPYSMEAAIETDAEVR